MASERWIKIMLCEDGDARANKIEDGVVWVTRTKWARIRNDKRIKQVNGPDKVINGTYSVVESGHPEGSHEDVDPGNRKEPGTPDTGGNSNG